MTKDDNPEPPKEQPTANLSEARKEELERATYALLHWMAEQIVNELVDEQRQQRAQVPETLASTARTKPQKPATTRAATKPGRSKQPQPQTAPPRCETGVGNLKRKRAVESKLNRPPVLNRLVE